MGRDWFSANTWLACAVAILIPFRVILTASDGTSHRLSVLDLYHARAEVLASRKENPMRPWQEFRRMALPMLLSLSLAVWSILPSISHVATIVDTSIVDTLQAQAQMIAGRGHSHGIEEDLLRAVHGHSHDAADHDHGQVLAARGDSSDPVPGQRAWPLRPSQERPYPIFRIERPPRA